MNEKGFLLVISGPSGAGKGTVVKQLIKNHNHNYALSISATTRSPRGNEKDGVHYFFKTDEEFKKMIEDKKFLEYASFCDSCYGTPIDYVNEQINKNKIVILEIDVQGGLQVKKIYQDSVLIFLAPPNMKELEKRLSGRATESIEKIQLRLQRAKEEFDFIHKYDYIIINDSVEKTVDDINCVVSCEKMKTQRNLNLKNILKGDF